MLLKKDGIRVNVQNERGETPLYIAALKGYEEIVVMLLSFPGIDVNAREFSNGVFFFFVLIRQHFMLQLKMIVSKWF